MKSFGTGTVALVEDYQGINKLWAIPARFQIDVRTVKFLQKKFK